MEAYILDLDETKAEIFCLFLFITDTDISLCCGIV